MADETQRDLAEKALALKLQNSREPDYLQHQEPTANAGAADTRPPEDKPVGGALDAEGHRPVLERSRKVR